jgi:hypothetical protein
MIVRILDDIYLALRRMTVDHPHTANPKRLAARITIIEGPK